MASAMQHPMPLDGQYAAAQLWKLDAVKGRSVPISAMLAEYLMLPAFPSARFKAWSEQYGRLPDAAMLTYVTILLTPYEEFPRRLSDDALIECKAMRIVGGVRVWINYHGKVTQFLSQREEIFGTSALTSIKIKDLVNDEERAFLGEWGERYECPWPYVAGQWINYRMPNRVHPQLAELYEQYKEFFEQWEAAVEYEPFDGDFNYAVRTYHNGVLHSHVAHVREPDPLEGLYADVAEETVRAQYDPPAPQLGLWYPHPEDGETAVPDDFVVEWD